MPGDPSERVSSPGETSLRILTLLSKLTFANRNELPLRRHRDFPSVRLLLPGEGTPLGNTTNLHVATKL
eukprot:4279467-Pyramimonas_sp.AAC.1